MVEQTFIRFWMVPILLFAVGCVQNPGDTASRNWTLPSSKQQCPESNPEINPVCEDLKQLATGLGTTTELISAARNYVHELNYAFQSDDSKQPIKGKFDRENPYLTLSKLKAGEIKFSCGGMSQVLQFVLTQLGIPSRVNQMATTEFLDGKVFTDTHVVVRAYDVNLGKFYLVDPTFNMSITCQDSRGELISDTPISFEDANECVNSGGSIVQLRGGYSPALGRDIGSYDLPYEAFFAAGKSEMFDSDGTIVPELELPYKGWLGDALSKYNLD